MAVCPIRPHAAKNGRFFVIEGRETVSTEAEIREALVSRHGELLSGATLQRCLGYRSARAYRRAIAQNALPVVTFALPGRRGYFARTRDVAAWLAVLGKPIPPSL